MSIAQRVGVPYNPGAFLPSLPTSFIYSPQFIEWRDAYYDIVILGAIHWRYNAGVIPSHLNKALKPAPKPAQ
jgi:BarA-like signal transduction histidine kinase